MRTFAQKQNQPEKPVSSNLARSGTATPGLHHHRTDLILHLQRTVGNQAVQRLLETQNETLEAGATNTASSRFAQDFNRIPIHPAAERVAQTKPASKPFEQRFGHIGRGGEALGSLRAPMESAFGSDFSGVRIHRDSRADDLNARAVTRGEDIHFDRGEDPAKPDGRELVAHELAHVVQQRNAPALSGSERMVDDPGLEGRADTAAHAVARGIRAPDPGTAPAEAIVQRQPKKKTPPRPPPTGGNILYVGMNNFAPEVAALRNFYKGTGVAVTTVTLTQEEKKTQTAATGGTKFDLTTDPGIDDFAKALSLDASKTKIVADLLKGADAFDRDDMAHVIAVYAMTEADGKDRLSRVVLSGHSRGEKIFAKGDKGDIYFTFLVALAGVFPRAAGQTKHLMGAACFAGDEDTIIDLYQPAFPSLVTFSGWTFFSPTGSEGVTKIRDWARVTDVDPTTLPAPAVGEVTWESGTYHGTNPQQSAADTMASLRLLESVTFDDYFNGDKVSKPFGGELVDYYIKANSAANRTRTITGADHDYAKLHADQAFRLRFWKAQVLNFWQTHQTEIKKGYGSTRAPDYGTMTRKAALKAIADFPNVAKGTATEQAAAQKLLDALKNLDPTIMKDSWI